MSKDPRRLEDIGPIDLMIEAVEQGNPRGLSEEEMAKAREGYEIFKRTESHLAELDARIKGIIE